MKINIFVFGAIALSFFQLVTASSFTNINHDMTSLQEKSLSPNAGSIVKRDTILEGLLKEVKDIVSALKLRNVPILDGDLLNLSEDNLISELLGLLGLSGGNGGSSNMIDGIGGANKNKSAEKVIKKFIPDGDDDEGDEDNREDQVNVILITTQKLLCSEGTDIEFLDKDNVLSSNSGSCVRSGHHDINLIQSLIGLLSKLLLHGGLGLGSDKQGLLGGLLCTVTKLVQCLLEELLGGVGGGQLGGIKREMLRRTLIQAVKASQSMN